MKQTETSFDVLAYKRKNTITPSTAYSFSESPEMIQNESDVLARNLALMQNQLASKLNQQAKYIGLQVPVLQNRNDLTDVKLEKVRKNKEIVKAVLKKLDGAEGGGFMGGDTDVQEWEQENRKELVAVCGIEKEIKEMMKKMKDFKRLERKEIILNDKINFYQNEIEKLKEYKQELSENLSDIQKGQKRVLEIFQNSKIKLESLITSKENLLVCIPEIQNPPLKLEKLKVELDEIKSSNLELRQLLSSYKSEESDISSKYHKKFSDYKKCLSNFHSREVLMKVQARYLEEKSARISFVKKELGDLEKSLSKFTSKTLQTKSNHSSRSPILRTKSINSKNQ